MFCRNCGSKLEEGKMFCGNCGTAREETVSPKSVPEPAGSVSEPAGAVSEPVRTVSVPAREDKKGLAVASMIIGIVSLVLFITVFIPIAGGIIAIILGIMAIKSTGRSMAIAGIITGGLAIIAVIVIIVIGMVFAVNERGSAYNEFIEEVGSVLVLMESLGSNVIDGQVEEFVLSDLSMESPGGWHDETERIVPRSGLLDEFSIEGAIQKTITNGTVRITVLYVKSDWFYTSDSATREVDASSRAVSDSYETVNGIEETIINGAEWGKIEYTGMSNGEKIKGLFLLHAIDYEVYIIRTESSEANYDRYIDEINSIIDTVQITSINRINTPEVLQKIVGEWDCGEAGYLVISADGTYRFYRDSSKDPDNVVWGTYEASDGIATHGAGYADGVTFYTTIEGFAMEGEEQQASGEQIHYAFASSEHEEDVFNARNMNAGSRFTMVRVE